MTPLHFFIQLLDKPHAPKIYRELRDAYQKQGKNNEAEAFSSLLEKKFGKTDDQFNNLDFLQKSTES